MKAVDVNSQLVDNYFALLKNLSTKSKLSLISKLTESIEADTDENIKAFEKAYGAWDENDKAEDIVSSIRNSRNFNRNIESF